MRVFLWVLPLRGKDQNWPPRTRAWGLDHSGPFTKKMPALLLPYEPWVPLSRVVGLGWVVGKEWDLCVGLGGRE